MKYEERWRPAVLSKSARHPHQSAKSSVAFGNNSSIWDLRVINYMLKGLWFGRKKAKFGWQAHVGLLETAGPARLDGRR
jgi:hypothetical protein